MLVISSNFIYACMNNHISWQSISLSNTWITPRIFTKHKASITKIFFNFCPFYMIPFWEILNTFVFYTLAKTSDMQVLFRENYVFLSCPRRQNYFIKHINVNFSTEKPQKSLNYIQFFANKWVKNMCFSIKIKTKYSFEKFIFFE